MNMSIMTILQWIQQYGIVFMFAAFLMILVRTFWPGSRGSFERDSRIPFQDER
jgi:cbb3-type cytochrome oxidase subunit 3